MNSSNPLMQFARRPELSVKLPSNGNWYEEGFIDYTMSGEVEVYPMLPKDELMMLNPDALLSGQANVDLIKSCCPSISDPKKLLYPDLNVLLLAIQRATYGPTLTMTVTCPHCSEMIDKIIVDIEEYNKTVDREEDKKDAKELIANMERERTLCTHEQDIDFNIDEILKNISFLDSEYSIELDNKLKVFIQPFTLENKAKFGLLSLNQERLYKALNNYNPEDGLKDEDMSEIRKQLIDCYLNINTYGNQLITTCIKCIKMPDDTIIDNKEMIYEFVSNTESKIIKQINQEITRISSIGATDTLTYTCDYCNYTWTSKFTGFNQVDFFDFSS